MKVCMKQIIKTQKICNSIASKCIEYTYIYIYIYIFIVGEITLIIVCLHVIRVLRSKNIHRFCSKTSNSKDSLIFK